MKAAISCLLLATTLLLIPLAAEPAEIEGRYKVIGKVPNKQSLDVVQFDEYLNFTCPHCNNFRKAALPIKKKYGKRIKVNYIPILFRNQSDAPLRLFFIGQSMGRTEEIKNLIFDAAFQAGVNIYDPAVVNYLARSSGLGDKYAKEVNAAWVTRKVAEAQQRAAEDGVRVTPSVVLQRALLTAPGTGMQAYVGNLDHLIGQLLRK